MIAREKVSGISGLRMKKLQNARRQFLKTLLAVPGYLTGSAYFAGCSDSGTASSSSMSTQVSLGVLLDFNGDILTTLDGNLLKESRA